MVEIGDIDLPDWGECLVPMPIRDGRVPGLPQGFFADYEFVGDHLIRVSRFNDINELERLRWRIVTHAQACYHERRRAFYAIVTATGAHACDGMGRANESWRLYLPERRFGGGWSMDHRSVSKPKHPKNLDIGQEFLRAEERSFRADRWVWLADRVVERAIMLLLKRDKRHLPQGDGVTNFFINGRDYLFQRHYDRAGPKLKPLAFPGQYGETPYQEIDLSVSSPRPGVVRTGRAYTTDEILPLIGLARPQDLDSDPIWVSGKRLNTFKWKGITCVRCGLEGTRFYKEKERRDAKRWTLSLYGVGANGNEILMTRDHIIPVSKGGSDSLKNSQTMCKRCNARKGNDLTEAELSVGHMR